MKAFKKVVKGTFMAWGIVTLTIGALVSLLYLVAGIGAKAGGKRIRDIFKITATDNYEDTGMSGAEWCMEKFFGLFDTNESNEKEEEKES